MNIDKERKLFVQRLIRSKTHHYRKQRSKTINIDDWTGRRLLYWCGTCACGRYGATNSLTIQKWFAEYFRRKFPDDSFWIPIMKRKGLIS